MGFIKKLIKKAKCSKLIIAWKTTHLKYTDSVDKFDLSFTSFSFFGKIFQNLNVSSPAPVTIVVPSGFIARYNTR